MPAAPPADVPPPQQFAPPPQEFAPPQFDTQTPYPPPQPYAQPQAQWSSLEPPAKKPFWKRWWFWLLAVLGALVALFVISLVSMFGGGMRHVEHIPAQAGDHALVGIWDWDDGANYRYVFNADGTGSRGFAPLIQRFDWSLDTDNLLLLEFRGATESVQFNVSGNRLTLDHRDGTVYHYTREGRAPFVPIDPRPPTTQRDDPTEQDGPPAQNGQSALVGTWNFVDHPTWQYFFHANGEGTRGGGGSPIEEFNWSVQGDLLRIESLDGEPLQFGVANERWTFAIDGDTLTLTSRQAEDMSFTYTRAGGLGSAAS